MPVHISEFFTRIAGNPRRIIRTGQALDGNASSLARAETVAAAHAALFDDVAARTTVRHEEIPLNCTRQPPARRASFAFFDEWLSRQPLDERRALDVGCGRGEVSVQIALGGARVSGVDISTESLSKARTLAMTHGVADRVALSDSNAESLPFDENSFDLAVSAGVMSFVDFDRVAEELARVIRPDGTVVLLDTLGHNPIANLGRRRRLALGRTTRFQVDHILTTNHLDRLRASFGTVEVHAFDFLTVPMMFVEDALVRIHPCLLRVTAPISAALRALDRVALRWRPLRRYAFRVVVFLRRPRVHEVA